LNVKKLYINKDLEQTKKRLILKDHRINNVRQICNTHIHRYFSWIHKSVTRQYNVEQGIDIHKKYSQLFSA